MDIRDIKSLIKMITETDITEFTMESEGEKVFIKRGAGQEVLTVAAPPAPVYVHAPATAPAIAAPPAAAAAAPLPTTAEEKGQPVTSPIVGTFYRAPSPDSAPYVEVGQTVEKGQVLCIVEAMKLMNEIEAEFRCRILKICKENAQPVEFGDSLFLVEPL